MDRHLGLISLLVRDYDEAIAYYAKVLGFTLVEDTPMEAGKRWVVVTPQPDAQTHLLLARAVTPEQADHVGHQAGGRVFLFLHSDDFWRDYRAMQARGVSFREAPRTESYGTVAVFEDLYGNRWDLVERARPPAPPHP